MSTQELIFLNYLSKVFENLNDAIMLFEVDSNRALNLLLVNNGFYKMTGFSPRPMDKLLTELEKATQNIQFIKHLHQATKTKDITETQITHPTPNGDITAQIKILPVLTSLGEVSHVVLLAHDVSDEVAKDARITELEAELKALKSK